MTHIRPESGFSEIIRAGNRLESLIAVRDRLAWAIETCSPRDLGPLTRQLTLLLAEIESLQAPKEGSKSDDIAAARAKRRAAAGVPEAPAAERAAGG